ncbi:MAG: Mth938-like domain-containing protein [Burkholderiaceae bacterium]
MKLHADRLDTLSITAYGEGWITINGQRHQGNWIISSSGRLEPWDCSDFESLTTEHFTRLATGDAQPPELVVFGSGDRLKFPHPHLLRGLTSQRIGVEAMDTMAACRTYNILAGEGRRVVAALLLPEALEHPHPGSR